METELAAIPEDTLADALSRLPAQSLAVARCVCKAWRGIVDDRGMLLPLLLPRSVHGIFINYIDHERPHLFARPRSSSAAAAIPEIDDMLSFLPNDVDSDWWSVMDHCGGLLLCGFKWESQLCVCNPATRRWTLLPPRAEGIHGYAGASLVFDPVVSPHYEVVLIPSLPKEPWREHHRKVKKKRPRRRQQEIDGPLCPHSWFSSPDDAGLLDEETQNGEESLPAMESAAPTLPPYLDEDEDEDDEEDEDEEPDDPCGLMEWPPSPWQLNVFSSRTGEWEARNFVREGEPVGTVKDMRLDPLERSVWGMRRRCSVYHNGALYVHCRGSFIMRLSLSSDKYQVINTPTNIGNAKPSLGISEEEVCFGFVHNGHLQVWILTESYRKIVWVLRYQDDISCYAHYASCYNNGKLMAGPWIVKEGKLMAGPWILKEGDDSVHDSNHTTETLPKEGFEWDSDNDDIIPFNVRGEENCRENFIEVLGFHPYKKVVFLARPFGAVAYHMNTSKAQYLGNSRPKCYYHNHSNGIYESFVYTPSMIGELQEGNIDQSTS